jgi:hypothetical protein
MDNMGRKLSVGMKVRAFPAYVGEGQKLEWFECTVEGIHPNGDPTTPQDENLANIPCKSVAPVTCLLP